MSSIIVSNSKRTEFDFSNIHINTQYNILLHCVYDPFNHFDTEFEFLKDPALTKDWLVILWHPVEAGVFEPEWINKLDSIVASATYKLVYLTGCSHKPNIHTIIPHDFDIRFFPVFDTRVIDIWSRNMPGAQEITTIKTKKFMCLNAKDISHRRYILAKLMQHDLLSQGTVSYQCTQGKNLLNFDTGQGFTENQLTRIREMSALTDNLIPMVLDGSDVINGLPRELFLDAYLGIIGETHFINTPFGFNRSFVSEKTFNAIANNQMFIVVGQAGSLDLLRSLGYQTFDPVINETYDTIVNNNGDRLEAVADEIIRFVSRPIEQIQQDYLQVIDIIEHNRNLLFSQSLERRLQQMIDTL
jgi:hypothetical protein